MFYRKLHGWKYRVEDSFWLKIPGPLPDKAIDHEFFNIEPTGEVWIKGGYVWDGASGALDTPSFMTPSAVHDMYYQLFRLGLMDRKLRKQADQLLKDMCVERGMIKVRAAWVYAAVRLRGGKAATPPGNKMGPILQAP